MRDVISFLCWDETDLVAGVSIDKKYYDEKRYDVFGRALFKLIESIGSKKITDIQVKEDTIDEIV